ncbi:MAG TPA: hypothetical protein VHD36_24640 [Pirellulales bacterium]|nr:hypothetical protein [Pirellulales bacterium]
MTRGRFLFACALGALIGATWPQPSALALGPSELAPPARQDSRDPQRLANLVQDLGASSFRVRERATRSLIEVGVPAKAVLLKALESPDAEVRYRARLVLSDVLELDFKQRLDDFIDDVGGTRDHDLPGWRRFREFVGDSPVARRLFIELERNESALLEAAELGVQQATTAFEARCQQIQEGMRVPGRQAERQVPVGTVAALLFIGADNNVAVNMQSAMCVTNFCYQQPFRQAIAGGDYAPLLKKLVGGWVRRDFASDPTAAYQSMMLALTFNVRDGVEPALAMLKDGGGNPHMRQYALLVVGKFGGPIEIDRLEPLLEDYAVCAQQQIAVQTGGAKNGPPNPNNVKNEVIETQIRDVALAVMIHLSGQKPADFGFERAQPNGTILFNTATLGFAKPDDREAALTKWRTWRAEHPTAK